MTFKKATFILIFFWLCLAAAQGQKIKLKVKFYPPVAVNNLRISKSHIENAKKLTHEIKYNFQRDTSFTFEEKTNIPFSQVYRSSEKRPEIIVLPLMYDNIDYIKVIIFSYNCQTRSFMGKFELTVSSDTISFEKYEKIKGELFNYKTSANRKGEIKEKFESHYFYFLAKWHQEKNSQDTASIYLKCGKFTNVRHLTEWDYTPSSFINEYKYYKASCNIGYIENRLHDVLFGDDCGRKWLQGEKGLDKCLRLRDEWSKYPVSMAYIDALVCFEQYRYNIKKDSALAEKFSTTFAPKFDYLNSLIDKKQYGKKEVEFWEKNDMSLIFERDTLIAKYKIISKCSELSEMAYQYENSFEYDEAMKYHFWALKFCHNKNSFERIETLLNKKEDLYRQYIAEGDSLCLSGNYEEGKVRYREAINFTLFPDLAISRINQCRPQDTTPIELKKSIISSQEIFDVIKRIVFTYNVVNFNELPGQQISFELDSKNSKKVNVFIVSNVDEADFVIHASYYPTGSYRFDDEETENGLIINILKTIDNVFGRHLDSTGIEINITGSADFSGFHGGKLRVEDEYKNKGLTIEDIRGGQFLLDNMINGSDYEKNLALAFLRGYRKQQAILQECDNINLKSSLQAKVEGDYGSKYRNVKVVLKMQLQ
ncbi:MAG TPA: hypothetical protein PLO67_09520 [Saprospiraceae bacterium]|nr:hypothetical protein [Saprospiraceae bacterium]HPI07290.1 hypothetical protein [Saprospiraceae bacterium]